MPRTCIVLLCSLVTVVSAAQRGGAETVVLSPDWNESNHQRVFLRGDQDLLWISADDAATSQQWQWLDFSSVLDRIEPYMTINSASLNWFGNVENDQSDGTTVWSVFPVPDDGSKGRITILEDGNHDGYDIVRYYRNNSSMAMGAVTTRQIADSSQRNPVSWDVTPLVDGWHEGTTTETVGEMIILNDRNRDFGRDNDAGFSGEDWINWGQKRGFLSGVGPTLSIDYTDSTATNFVQLQPGDADQDLDFDQRDLVQVQIAAKYLTGRAATWGEGDWDAGPGGRIGQPPVGDGRFDQRDIIAALAAGMYLAGPYGTFPSSDSDQTVQPDNQIAARVVAGPAAALSPNGRRDDSQTSVVYDANSGEVRVDAPAGVDLTSISIDSASGVFSGDRGQHLGGSFDHRDTQNVFKATFGSSFGSLSFGQISRPGLEEAFVLADFRVDGSLAGGGGLGPVDLVYLAPVPEPAAMSLLWLGLLGLCPLRPLRPGTP